MTLREAQEGKEYVIEQINVDDEELVSFLFSLVNDMTPLLKRQQADKTLLHLPALNFI